MVHIYPNGLTGYGCITHTPADPPAAAAVPQPTNGHSALHTVSRPLKRPAELAPTFFKVSAFTSTWTTKVMGVSGAWEEGPKMIMSAEGERGLQSDKKRKQVVDSTAGIATYQLPGKTTDVASIPWVRYSAVNVCAAGCCQVLTAAADCC